MIDQVFKQTVPKFSGKTSNFSVYKHELIKFARNEDVDWVFTESGDSSRDVEVGNADLSVRSLKATYTREVVRANIRVRQMLVESLQHKRDRDILFRVHSPGAVWRELNSFYNPKTSGAKLALIEKYDNVKISVRDDPVQKLIKMEGVARQLRAYDTDINLTGSHTLLKFVNALPPENNHQRQSMEEHDTLSMAQAQGYVLYLLL